jgi:hypothetical protein
MVTCISPVVRLPLALADAQQLVITVMISNMIQLVLTVRLVAAGLMIRHFLVVLSQTLATTLD